MSAELEAMRAELERERMRLTACGVVAMANTPESAERQRKMKDEYWSASLDEVIRAVDAEMALRAEVEELRKDLAYAQTAYGELFSKWQEQRAKLAESEAKRVRIAEAAERAIGDHHAPNDCYATGPLTGDSVLDLVECPACSLIAALDAARGKP